MRWPSSQRSLVYRAKPELLRRSLSRLITPEEPDETRAPEEASRVSSCFHGLRTGGWRVDERTGLPPPSI